MDDCSTNSRWDTCNVEKMGCTGCYYSDPDEKKKIHSDILKQIAQLYSDKNHDYGDSVSKTFDKYGLTSFLVRMEDKMNRLEALNKTDDVRVKGEKIEDTLLDLANYAILAVVEIKTRVNNLLHEPEFTTATIPIEKFNINEYMNKFGKVNITSFAMDLIYSHEDNKFYILPEGDLATHKQIHESLKRYCDDKHIIEIDGIVYCHEDEKFHIMPDGDVATHQQICNAMNILINK